MKYDRFLRCSASRRFVCPCQGLVPRVTPLQAMVALQEDVTLCDDARAAVLAAGRKEKTMFELKVDAYS
jgi:hypothetical protein